MKPRFLSRIRDIPSEQWNALVPYGYPFARFEFLDALESSGCVSADSGWIPRHLILEDNQELIAAMPLYQKDHSYGEYVFDWQWASAFERYGRAYYPKLLTAIPFSPVTGPRVLLREGCDLEQALGVIKRSIQLLAKQGGISSWHLLFVNKQLGAALSDTELLHRQDVQFHWQNKSPETGRPYSGFEEFLQGFRSSKRKQIRRERRKIEEQGVRMSRISGTQIKPEDWASFYACYQRTYLKRSGHGGYLNKAFFEKVANRLAGHCMLVMAHQDDDLVASSLFFFDEQRLYGRYWGSLAHYDCLHFETCYYQGIEFAIEKGLSCFDPGTQGEHKLVRGFEPIKTHSYHWLGDAEFSRAIDEFLARERQHTDRYQQAAAQHLPFRKGELSKH